MDLKRAPDPDDDDESVTVEEDDYDDNDEDGPRRAPSGVESMTTSRESDRATRDISQDKEKLAT